MNRIQTQPDENPPRLKRIQTQCEILQPPKIRKDVPTHQNWDDVLARKYEDVISGGPIFIVRICDWMYKSFCNLLKMLFLCDLCSKLFQGHFYIALKSHPGSIVNWAEGPQWYCSHIWKQIFHFISSKVSQSPAL